jgi:hypothetical protein
MFDWGAVTAYSDACAKQQVRRLAQTPLQLAANAERARTNQTLLQRCGMLCQTPPEIVGNYRQVSSDKPGT